MKHVAQMRVDGVFIKDFTDSVVASLREPYKLIAEWSQYVPLKDLLMLPAIAIAVYEDNDDATVTMTWHGAGEIDRDFIVLRDRQKRTVAYLRPGLRDPIRGMMLAPHENTIFVVGIIPVTVEHVAKSVFDAVASLLNVRREEDNHELQDMRPL